MGTKKFSLLKAIITRTILLCFFFFTISIQNCHIENCKLCKTEKPKILCEECVEGLYYWTEIPKKCVSCNPDLCKTCDVEKNTCKICKNGKEPLENESCSDLDQNTDSHNDKKRFYIFLTTTFFICGFFVLGFFIWLLINKIIFKKKKKIIDGKISPKNGIISDRIRAERAQDSREQLVLSKDLSRRGRVTKNRIIDSIANLEENFRKKNLNRTKKKANTNFFFSKNKINDMSSIMPNSRLRKNDIEDFELGFTRWSIRSHGRLGTRAFKEKKEEVFVEKNISLNEGFEDSVLRKSSLQSLESSVSGIKEPIHIVTASISKKKFEIWKKVNGSIIEDDKHVLMKSFEIA